jgi:hypothetical protein
MKDKDLAKQRRQYYKFMKDRGWQGGQLTVGNTTYGNGLLYLFQAWERYMSDIREKERKKSLITIDELSRLY